MDIFKRRGIKREDVLLVLSACVFAVFFWAFLNIFNNFPSYIQQRTPAEMVGISSYILTFALFESLLYFVILFPILCLAALVLPKKFLGEHLAPAGAVLALLIAAIVMYIQYDYETLTSLSIRRILFYLGLIGLAYLAYYIVLIRFPKVDQVARSIFQRVSVLSVIYAVFGVLGVLIVVLRNVF